MQCNADSDMETPGQDETTQSPSNGGSLETPTLRRTRVACKACNQRRVKCDAGEGQPCWHCRIRQTPCELIESRRGKYTRRKEGHRKSPRASKHPKTPRATSIRGNRESPNVADASDRANTLDTNDGATRLEPSHEGEGPPQHSQPPQSDQINPILRPQHLGDSSLSYTVEVVYSPKGGSSEPLKVRYPIPASISNRAAPSHETEVKEPVSLQEALELPPKDIADQLVRTFFEIIHPAYPVFDRKKFASSYSQNQASPLVLHTIFLLGFTIGSESLVQEAGYSSRATARRKHYLRAKALYDADYDNDRSNVVACLLLLGFWWAGPEDQKDTCYWVGCATNVAQSTGMHRSYVTSTHCRERAHIILEYRSMG
ncbi:unnamed protein product [Penicillium salamii]|uniref:Zn(2)-C6 fungal-type domain-containing protein n=1 Tax=Penicillium salamii TaxID=1612424 RepID=A0A9W4N0H0_9EURO|nr:unnamed protein product [Penicillium salamii]CAG8202957.1 unnamed protein product [Penicillium salamii]CAG8243419.1 unnamed protein product [Penicillium salamii]CAG8267016.1 unnamed protein product [Penicillium salamii]CAG8377985.1 unnamed protein product [Penicillium salamii]